MCIYQVYHIQNHPKDGQPYVGCTKDLNRRMREHEVSVNKVEVLYQSEDIFEASYAEQSWQERILGKSDGFFYHLSHTEESCQKQSKLSRGVSKGSMSIEHRQSIGDALRGQTLSASHCQSISDALRGLKKSVEHRQSIGDALRGVLKGPHSCSRTSEHRQKIGELHQGRVWITNGIISKMIYPEQLQSFLEQGWKRGRMKFKKSNKETNQCLQ